MAKKKEPDAGKRSKTPGTTKGKSQPVQEEAPKPAMEAAKPSASDPAPDEALKAASEHSSTETVSHTAGPEAIAIGDPTGIVTRPPIIFHPPIFTNSDPVISSLSPPGAVVGGPGFTLTVFGSNFGAASTVTWNATVLPTTSVSSTQLTAAVPDSNLAAAQAANIVVSNQGAAGTAPVLSNAVPFNVIPDISAIISQLQQVTANAPSAPALLSELQTYITIQQTQIDGLNAQVSADQTNYANLNSQYESSQNTVSQQATQITQLQAQVIAAQAQSASPLDVAQSFKSVLDTIQQNAQSAGGLQSTVTNMNIQIKSLLSVQAATSTAAALATMIFPSPTALPDPAHLSTLQLSFGSIPNLQTGLQATQPQPPKPAPTPAPQAPTPAPAAPAQVRAGGK